MESQENMPYFADDVENHGDDGDRRRLGMILLLKISMNTFQPPRFAPNLNTGVLEFHWGPQGSPLLKLSANFTINTASNH